MTTLEMIDNALRYGVYNKSQLIDCKAEIERLEKQNTLLKSALTQILTNSEQMEVHEFGDATVRIVQNALHGHH